MRIKWCGKLSEENSFSATDVPENAVEFLNTKSKIKSYIMIIPIILFIIICIYFKYKITGRLRANRIGYFIGFLSVFPFMLVHELLHAVSFPVKAKVEMFYSMYGLSVSSPEPISKIRYIVVLIVPAVIIGVIPLIGWIFIPSSYVTINTMLFILAIGNLAGTTGDLYNLTQVIKLMPKNSFMQVSGLKCFFYDKSVKL